MGGFKAYTAPRIYSVEVSVDTLTDKQKSQARENIDAVSKLDLNTRLGGLTIIHNDDGSISITDGEPEE